MGAEACMCCNYKEVGRWGGALPLLYVCVYSVCARMLSDGSAAQEAVVFSCTSNKSKVHNYKGGESRVWFVGREEESLECVTATEE